MAGRRALIFANGEWRDGPALRECLAEARRHGATVIAADGGARHALVAGFRVDALIGDLDSTTPALARQLESSGAKIIRYPQEKDETDLELCLRWAIAQGLRHLRIVTALGGRADQTMGNILSLTTAELRDCDVALIGAREQLRILHPGAHTLQGVVGARLSLLPLKGDARAIRTRGLRYPLRGETLRFGRGRGLSNEFCAPRAEITFTAGILLCIQSAKYAEAAPEIPPVNPP